MNGEPTTNPRRPLWGIARQALWLIFGSAFLLVLLTVRPFAAFGDNALFVNVSEREARELQRQAGSGALRSRVVRVNDHVLRPDAREIKLNLFNDLTLTATRARVDTPLTGGYVWVGSIPDDPGGSVTLAVYNGVLAGAVYRGGRVHTTIRSLGTGDLYAVRELDPRAPEPGGQDALQPPRTSTSPDDHIDGDDDACEEDGSVIDVMVTFTTAARVAAGGPDAIQALISMMISDMNSANDASQAGFDWRLVRTAELDYAESGDMATDLQRLQKPGDGSLDEVHGLRDTHAADLVSLLIADGNGSACGMAYQWTDPTMSFDAYAFGVVALDYPGDYTCSQLTMAHEFGHNIGNAHDRANTSLPGLMPYSYGYQSPERTFRDIMAYNCDGGCPRINQWANPDVWYNGEPTGVDYETNPANAADLVRSMNDARQEAANFRPNCPAPAPTETPQATATVAVATETPVPSPTPSPSPTASQPTPAPTATIPLTPTYKPMTRTNYLPAVIVGR